MSSSTTYGIFALKEEFCGVDGSLCYVPDIIAQHPSIIACLLQKRTSTYHKRQCPKGKSQGMGSHSS
jgi:hypothetical protein